MKKTRYILIFVLLSIVIISFIPFGSEQSIRYIDRGTSEIKTEKVAGEFWLKWLYNNPVGKASLEALVKRKIISDYYGKMMDKPESKEKIAGFVKQFNINLQEAQKQNFENFNDFFTRKLKPEARKIDTNKNVIISPADGKVLAYSNISKQDFIVKSYKFNLETFLNDKKLAEKYKSGSLIIIRLCPVDYHRYHFPFTGNVLSVRDIDGDYYSVSPFAIKKKIEIICQNKRRITELKAEVNNKEMIYAEVGATMVGSIVDTYQQKAFNKADEKGYFKFGGSTIVLIFQKGDITIDKDLLKNTAKSLETSVKMGERIAVFNL